MRRVVVVLFVVLALSACGGSGGGTTSDPSAQIKSSYEQFFSPKTSVPDRVAVLQDGSRFKSLVASFASNPLAKNASVDISSVKPNGDHAEVVYTVKLGGVALPKQTGTAVRENGKWKVGYASLCKLVALQGSTPSACKS